MHLANLMQCIEARFDGLLRKGERMTVATISPKFGLERLPARERKAGADRRSNAGGVSRGPRAIRSQRAPRSARPRRGDEIPQRRRRRTALCDLPPGSAEQACEKFLQAGFDNVINVEGGTQLRTSSGLPLVRGKKAMSLERQVRIVGRLLVLTGAVLGSFVHPYFIGLSAFIGAGPDFPASLTPVGWRWCWPGCHGTVALRHRSVP